MSGQSTESGGTCPACVGAIPAHHMSPSLQAAHTQHQAERDQVCTCPDDCDCDGYGPLRENNVQTCTDHDKCCRYLLCAHPKCCGYYGKVLAR